MIEEGAVSWILYLLYLLLLFTVFIGALLIIKAFKENEKKIADLQEIVNEIEKTLKENEEV
ncbi:protein of unknown function (plasmid) [Thermococcus nautili]|uniref:hypothetical protein n=1 Tax=Thermococcus nautili TaxID=195522 RepID=UPI002553E94B|nr:hypothetical protein [Thermococcus nautili]CAI1494256.1 protein of unknown function [Thermococcus nautili]